MVIFSPVMKEKFENNRKVSICLDIRSIIQVDDQNQHFFNTIKSMALYSFPTITMEDSGYPMVVPMFNYFITLCCCWEKAVKL